MNLLTADLDHILAHTQSLWEELRDQRLFLSGGTGFIGCWLLESFAHANDQIQPAGSRRRVDAQSRHLCRQGSAPGKRPDLEFVTGDARNFPFPEWSFSHVIHAGTTSSAPVEPGEMFATIVDGTPAGC
jgi:dTDP-glucose 4,6-dehydratase